MDSRLQLRVQRYGWDRAAPDYERGWAAQLRPAQDRLMSLAALGSGERVLDLACGTGLVTLRAAEAVGPSGSVVATDISDAMVAAVTAEAARRSLTWVTAHRADAESFPFDDASFDAVLCGLGLMYAPDPLGSLAGALRVIRPGGRFVAAVWGARNKCGWAEIFPIVERRVASEVCPLFFQLGTGDALRLAMEAAGYGSVTVEHLETILEYDSADTALAAAFLGGPVAMAYSRFDQPTRSDVQGEYLESIAPFRHGEGYRIPGAFVVARGDKPV
ncbi:MAG: class I SAM-dependent methyltransferase [Gemmatimonadales bacterium]